MGLLYCLLAVVLLFLPAPSSAPPASGEGPHACLWEDADCDPVFKCLWGDASCEWDKLWNNSDVEGWSKLWGEQGVPWPGLGNVWHQGFEYTTCANEVGDPTATVAVSAGAPDCDNATRTAGNHGMWAANVVTVRWVENDNWPTDYSANDKVYVQLDYNLASVSIASTNIWQVTDGAQTVRYPNSLAYSFGGYPWMYIYCAAGSTILVNDLPGSTWYTIQMDIDQRSGQTQRFRIYNQATKVQQGSERTCVSAAINSFDGFMTGKIGGGNGYYYDELYISDQPFGPPE